MLKILLTTFVIMSHFAIAEEKTEKIEKPSTEKQPTQCHDLHKVTDIDDLLLQMYNNLDSHCLFEMPKKELEKIWGFPVFGQINLAQYEEEVAYQKSGEGLFVSRFYSDKDDCLSRSRIYIKLTNSYKNKHQGLGGSFEKYLLPKKLPHPEPLRSILIGGIPSCFSDKKGDYKGFINYYWGKSEDPSSPTLLLRVGCAKPKAIEMLYCQIKKRKK